MADRTAELPNGFRSFGSPPDFPAMSIVGDLACLLFFGILGW
ncbi:MAG: hypothetical protein ACYDAA_00440 [Syntrophales bacterium]